MTKEEFKNIVSNYQGAIGEVGEVIKIESRNRLIAYYDNGKIWKDTYAKCTIELNCNCLNAWEDSYELLGGVGYPSNLATEKTLVELLKRYNFSKKEQKQMSIFDI